MLPENQIGVVVIGRNEGERLIKCMQSLQLSAHTIVYVDSGSTDCSVSVAKELGLSVVNLNMNEPFTAARARNEGFAKLMTLEPAVRYVQFVDGDCELVPGWLDTALDFLSRNPDIAVVCGRRRERHPEASVYNRLCDIEWDTPIGEATACGGDALLRVDAFQSVAGFRKQLVAGEEPEFCLRLRHRGWRIWRLDAEMTLHDAAMSRFGQWWLRAVRSGYGFTEVAHLHGHSGPGIYASEVRRLVTWAALVPLGIVLGAVFYPAAIAAALVYPLQVCRIALRRGATKSMSWVYAIFVMIAKFAEFQGFLRFYARPGSWQAIAPIEYKE